MAIYNNGTYLVVNKQLCLYFFAHFEQNLHGLVVSLICSIEFRNLP
jgi:hypothetical protein